MMIYCRLCRRPFTSNKPPGKGEADLIDQMGRHMATHPEEAEKLAKDFLTASSVISSYLLIVRYVNIPSNEKTLLKSFDTIEKSLIDLFGFLEYREPEVKKLDAQNDKAISNSSAETR
jgi:hypothetical protein